MSTIELCKVQHYVPIDKLKFHPDNPRTIKPERLEELKRSIRKKGFYQPILVWKKGGIVLAGNHRLLAARELVKEGFEFKAPDGKTNVLPVVIEDVAEEVAEAILFETNNTYAEWVEEKLRKALEDAEAAGVDINQFGFTQDYVDALLKNAAKEADEILKESEKGEREIEPVDGTKLREALGEEEFESIILPKGIYEQLTDILGKIAVALNDDWKPGDSYAQATQALCQSIYESGILDSLVDKIEDERIDL